MHWPEEEALKPTKNLWNPEDWAAVKELELSYNIGGTLLFTRHTHYGYLI